MAWSDLNPQTQGSIIGSAGSVAGSLIGGAFNLGGMALQHKYNKEMAALQNQYNIDMWNMQNEYNSPTAQMSRLRDAGLNPNLAYGNVSTGNASKAPEMVAPNAPNAQQAMKDAAASLNPEQIISFAINTRKGLAEAQKAEEDARKAGAEAEMVDALAQSMNLSSNHQFYYFNPETGQIEKSPESEVFTTRFSNRYRRDVNMTQASLRNAMQMRNEYLKGANYSSQIGYRGKQGLYIDARTGLTKEEAQRVGNINDWFTYNEILKGVHAGAHLVGSFGNIFNLIGRAKGLFDRPQRPLQTGRSTTGVDGAGRSYSSKTVFHY